MGKQKMFLSKMLSCFRDLVKTSVVEKRRIRPNWSNFTHLGQWSLQLKNWEKWVGPNHFCISRSALEYKRNYYNPSLQMLTRQDVGDSMDLTQLQAWKESHLHLPCSGVMPQAAPVGVATGRVLGCTDLGLDS